jgi:hypothetical protein
VCDSGQQNYAYKNNQNKVGKEELRRFKERSTSKQTTAMEHSSILVGFSQLTESLGLRQLLN